MNKQTNEHINQQMNKQSDTPDELGGHPGDIEITASSAAPQQNDAPTARLQAPGTCYVNWGHGRTCVRVSIGLGVCVCVCVHVNGTVCVLKP